jgi:hypothetical protein
MNVREFVQQASAAEIVKADLAQRVWFGEIERIRAKVCEPQRSSWLRALEQRCQRTALELKSTSGKKRGRRAA